MIPEILKSKAPRDIQYSDDLFKKNREKARNIFLFSVLLTPLMGALFWWQFDDFMSGLYWGFGLTALCELFGFAMMMNAKMAVNICQNGLMVLGTVEKCSIHGNTKGGAGYILVQVGYKENLGRELSGMVTYIGNSEEIDLKEGDQIPVVFLNEKPEKFILWSESLGISTIGKSKDKK